MTKQEVKDLCEDDKEMCWWAMVLFAEIMEVGTGPHAKDRDALYLFVKWKVEEFPRLLVQRQLSKAKEKFLSQQVQEPEG